MPPETVKNSNSKPALILVALLVIIVAVFLLMTTGKKVEVAPETDKPTTQENVKIQEIDISKVSGAARVPAAFPDDLPIDTSAITKSYVADFPDRGATQNTVSYNSTKNVKTLYAEYLSYMTKNKYVFAEGGKSEAQGFLYGTKDNDDLSVVVRIENTLTIVDITYLDRK